MTAPAVVPIGVPAVNSWEGYSVEMSRFIYKDHTVYIMTRAIVTDLDGTGTDIWSADLQLQKLDSEAECILETDFGCKMYSLIYGMDVV